MTTHLRDLKEPVHGTVRGGEGPVGEAIAALDRLREAETRRADAYEQQNQYLREALTYALEKRGRNFDYDAWAEMTKNALDGRPTPSALENEISQHALTKNTLAQVESVLDYRSDRIRTLEEEVEGYRNALREACGMAFDLGRETEAQLDQAVSTLGTYRDASDRWCARLGVMEAAVRTRHAFELALASNTPVDRLYELRQRMDVCELAARRMLGLIPNEYPPGGET